MRTASEIEAYRGQIIHKYNVTLANKQVIIGSVYHKQLESLWEAMVNSCDTALKNTALLPAVQDELVAEAERAQRQEEDLPLVNTGNFAASYHNENGSVPLSADSAISAASDNSNNSHRWWLDQYQISKPSYEARILAEQGGTVTIDSTAEGIMHYFLGGGRAVNIGDRTFKALQNRMEQLDVIEKIKSGEFTESPLTVDLASKESRGSKLSTQIMDRNFYIGRTTVNYEVIPDENKEGYSCIQFTAFRGDGFWDIYGDADGAGPENEHARGTPYAFNKRTWFSEPFPTPNFRKE